MIRVAVMTPASTKSSSNIASIATGIRRPRARSLARLTKAIGVSGQCVQKTTTLLKLLRKLSQEAPKMRRQLLDSLLSADQCGQRVDTANIRLSWSMVASKLEVLPDFPQHPTTATSAEAMVDPKVIKEAEMTPVSTVSTSICALSTESDDHLRSKRTKHS